MSYEGYDQNLCARGHYWCSDAYDHYDTTPVCPLCKLEAVWTNQVDETNCESFGYIDMSQFMVHRATTETCPTCNHTKVIKPDTYRVPTEEETEKARVWKPCGQQEFIPIPELE